MLEPLCDAFGGACGRLQLEKWQYSRKLIKVHFSKRLIFNVCLCSCVTVYLNILIHEYYQNNALEHATRLKTRQEFHFVVKPKGLEFGMNSKLQIHELGNEAKYFQWMTARKKEAEKL